MRKMHKFENGRLPVGGVTQSNVKNFWPDDSHVPNKTHKYQENCVATTEIKVFRNVRGALESTGHTQETLTIH